MEKLQMADEAIEELYALMKDGESAPARVSAAKALLQRLSPKQFDDTEKREAEEREHAIAEARGFLAAFAALRTEFLLLKEQMDRPGKASTDNA